MSEKMLELFIEPKIDENNLRMRFAIRFSSFRVKTLPFQIFHTNLKKF